jgi:hypothetical protein
MNHWICWFNDYMQVVRTNGCADGFNQVIMFKSCYPISNIGSDGTEPGDPFSGSKTLANYKAVYRHPAGIEGCYTNDGYEYKALECVFTNHPDILFIPVTAPPRHYGATTDAEASRARTFNNWLKHTWFTNYQARNPNLNNVAVFDWFDVLANPADHSTQPNRLQSAYGGTSGDSHPNSTGNAASTVAFAGSGTNFLDDAWDLFDTGGESAFYLRAFALTNQAVLRWPDPVSCGAGDATVHIRFATDTYPAGLLEGTALYTGTNQTQLHTNLTPGQTYYYTVWLSDDGSNFREPRQ